MTILFQLATENGTNGADATTALTGYTTLVNQAPKYDNSWAIAGNLALRCVGVGNPCIGRKDFADKTSIYVRKYMRWESLPSAASAFWVFLDSAGVTMLSVRGMTDGTVQLRNASSSQVAISTHAFAAGDVLRVEINAVVAGTTTVRLFYGSQLHSATPSETISGTTPTAGTGFIGRMQEGQITGVTWTTAWDETVIQDTTWVGPIGGGSGSPYPITSTTAAVSAYSASLVSAVQAGNSRVRVFVGDPIAAPPTDVLTNGGRWAWGGFGYAYPGSTFAAEAGGMRLSWGVPVQNVGGNELGCFAMDPAVLISGHEIKVKVVVQVPVGSPDVRLTSAFNESGKWLTLKGKDAELTLRFPWDPGLSNLVGIESAAGANTGSVLVKLVKVMDLTVGNGHWSPQASLPTADITPPTTPGTPAATVTNQSVALTWTASTDDVAVTGYEVHRSATTGFTPSGATLKVSVPTNAWTENSVPVGTWYYKVIAVDAAGNKSTASAQRSVTTTAAAVASILPMISTDNGFEGINDWPGYRVYNPGALASVLNSTGSSAGQARPQVVFYSKQGTPFSGSYASIKAAAMADLDGIYYVGGATSQTHSANWNVKVVWSNGNENFDKGMLSGAATSPANVALYVDSQRALYDACHYIDPVTGQRRYPNAWASTNPTTFSELNDDNAIWLQPAARYCDIIFFSGYPPGRTNTNTDPTFNWDSLNPADYNNSSLGFLTRCYRRVSLARAQARIDTGDSTRDIQIGFGELGIPSDPGDNTTRPYYMVFGIFGACAQLSTSWGLTTMGISYWNATKSGGPHNILHDEGAASDHATGQPNPNPTTAQVIRNWTTYHPSYGGTKPGAWSANPKSGWKHTGTQV